MNLNRNNKITKLALAGFITLNASISVTAEEKPANTFGNAVDTHQAAQDAAAANKAGTAVGRAIRDGVVRGKAAEKTKAYKSLPLLGMSGGQYLGELLKTRLAVAESDRKYNEIIAILDAAILNNVAAGEIINQEVQATYIQAVVSGYDAALAVVALEAKASTVLALALKAQSESEDATAYAKSDAKASVDNLVKLIEAAVVDLNANLAKAKDAGIDTGTAGSVGAESAKRTRTLAASAGTIADRVAKQQGQLVEQRAQIAVLNKTVAEKVGEIAALNTRIEEQVQSLQALDVKFASSQLVVSSLKDKLAESEKSLVDRTRELEISKIELGQANADAAALASRLQVGSVKKAFGVSNDPLVSKYLPPEPQAKALTGKSK